MSDRAWRPTARAAGVLAACALVGGALVAYTQRHTAPLIEANQEAAIREQLRAVLPEGPFQPPVTRATRTVQAPEALGTEAPVTVYRAYRDGEPVAAALTTVAADGYNGPIRLLVGLRYDGTVAGVRVLEHRETPGLGDLIEADKSDWLRQFRGRGLGAPPREQWRVAADGGAFDQITGATITPRAVVRALRRTLVYFRAQREALFAQPTDGEHRTNRSDPDA